MRKRTAALLFLLSVISLKSEVVYQKPSREILEVLNAPAPPVPSLNPSKTHILLLERRLYPTIAELASPMYRLAGERINPSNNGQQNPPVVITSLTLKNIQTGEEVRISVPAGARMKMPAWSPDGRRFAILNYTNTAVDLYLGTIDSRELRTLPVGPVNDADDRGILWWAGSQKLLVKTVPANRGSAPQPPAAPAGPNVQESYGKAAGVWTYQDLLRSPYDEKLFDYYFTSQLVSIEIGGGRKAMIGKPGIFADVDPSPDGLHILVSRVVRPYSYLLTWREFPQEIEVWSQKGDLVHKVHSAPLQDYVSIDGVPTGPRNVGWRPTEPATLFWFEALDGGDPKAKVPYRDRLMTLQLPFKGPAAEVVKIQNRAMGLTFGTKEGLALITDYDREKRWLRTFRISLEHPDADPKVVWSRSARERYKDPGSPVLKRLPNGKSVLQQDGDNIFLAGQGATPHGDQPFLDRMNLTSLQTERLFHAGPKGYESVFALLSEDGARFITSYESPEEPPNLYLRSTGTEERKALTSFRDSAPQIRRIQQKLVKYKREDGVDLSFTLLLPPDYREGTRLPTILYAYPLEYNDPQTAGQVEGSTQRFVSIRGASHLFLLLAGYAVLNNATIPIVGDFETVNNTYVEQLVSSAKAAVNQAVALGVTDPNRVGVTGHSYGGFMTANLLAHCDLFRAGVARSGAYNRTLTPFGFQSERRTFWEARDTYMKMSPFNYADKIKEPILLIHGEADNNSGTFPIQSERLYEAIRGNGGRVRLVMLPHEAHGYAAQESIEHVIWETQEWFDRYLKNGGTGRPTD
jgi:dipeptidyl aminopeptidase/acylaminoacyl peptidase